MNGQSKFLSCKNVFQNYFRYTLFVVPTHYNFIHSITVLSRNEWANLLRYEPVHEKNQLFGVPTRSDKNQTVQSQKTATSLKFWI